jgi:hypothetical protein
MKKIIFVLFCFTYITFLTSCDTLTGASAKQNAVSSVSVNNTLSIPSNKMKNLTNYFPLIGKSNNAGSTLTLYVTGRGAPPTDTEYSDVQKYLLAERAAIADGYRLLSEKLEGVFIEAYTKSGYYTVEYDRIHLATKAFIKGAEIVSIKHKDNGVCQAELKITVPREQLCCYFPQTIVNHVNSCFKNHS